MTTVHQAQPIAAGYAYGIRLQLDGGTPAFPNGCALRAEVRDYAGAPTLAGVLTSESGMVSVVDPQTVELFMSAALTGALSRQTCAIDLVRTDLSPARWVGVQLALPVVTTVTRSDADALSPGRVVVDQGVPALATISAPMGVTVTLSEAEGAGPWNQPQVIAVASISSTVTCVAPLLERGLPAGIVPLPISSTSFGTALLTMFASPATIASTSVVTGPAVGLAPPGAITVDPASSTTIVAAPIVAVQGPGIVTVAAPAASSQVFAPSVALLANGQGIAVATIPSTVAVPSPTVSFTASPTGPRLSFSGPVSQGVAIPAGTKLANRAPGTTFATTMAGVTIDSATGVVSGTPTVGSGLFTETFPDGSSHNSLLFAPTTGSRSTKVGINMGQWAYFLPNYVFLNYLLIADAGDTAEPAATVDANGVPQTLATYQGVQRATYAVPFDYTNGVSTSYRLLTDGDIDATITDPLGSSSAFASDGNGHIVASYTGHSTGGGLFRITRIGATKPTYIAVVRADEAALYLAGTTKGYKQQYIDFVSNFSRIRFMDWSNGNQQLNSDAPAAAFSYVQPGDGGGGRAFRVPTQVQVDLCIVANVPGWFNPHATITDAQYQAMWPQFDRHVAAGLGAPTVEYSNELWNSAFWQTRTYATAHFDALPGTGVYAPPASSPGPGWIDNVYCKNLFWNGYRSTQLAKLTHAAGKNYAHVIGVQPGSDPYALVYLDQGVAFAGGDYTLFRRLITTTYSSGDWSQPSTQLAAGRDAVQKAIVAARDFDAAADISCNFVGTTSLSIAALGAINGQDKTQANARGLLLSAYEGNPNVYTTVQYNNDPAYAAYDQFYLDLTAHPLGRGMMRQSLDAADARGFDEVMIYDGAARPIGATSSRDGDWGIYGQPSYQGVLDFLARPYVPRVTFENTSGNANLTGNQIEGFAYRAARADTRLIVLGA